MSTTTGSTSVRPVSFATPFRQTAFAVIWTATLVSNVGGWMYSAASGWLMTSLNPDPFVVALVQVADTLPICLLALPAGALADIFDKRKFLIVVEVLTTVVSAIYAVIVGVGWATPENLLLFTFLVGAAGALTVPAWQSVVPQLVPRDDLPAAIAANSVGVNISRGLGPALGGVTISGFGIVAPFWINAISNLGIVGALLWWREARRSKTRLPAEPFGQAVSADCTRRGRDHLAPALGASGIRSCVAESVQRVLERLKTAPAGFGQGFRYRETVVFGPGPVHHSRNLCVMLLLIRLCEVCDHHSQNEKRALRSDSRIAHRLQFCISQCSGS